MINRFLAAFLALFPLPVQADPVGLAVVALEPKETFGTKALGMVLELGKQLVHDIGLFFHNFAVLSKLSDWVHVQLAEQTIYERWLDIGQVLAVTLAGAYLLKYLIELLFFPMRKKLRDREIHVPYLRFAAALMRLLIILVPTIVFLGVALFALTQVDPDKLTRSVVLMAVYALALYQLCCALLRFILAPRSETLRFIPISNDTASFFKRWGKWYAGVIIFGTYLAEMALRMKVPSEAVTAFKSLIALTVIMMTIAIIMKKKSIVSVAIRGNLSAASSSLGFVGNLRLWAARMWHVLAIAYLLVGYLITMMGQEGSFWILQQGTIGTLLAIVSMRFLLYLTKRFGHKKSHSPMTSLPITGGIYRPVLRVLFKFTIWTLGITLIMLSWGIDVEALVMSSWGQRISGSVFSIITAVLILVGIYEAVHVIIQSYLYKMDDEGNVIEADARLRTLLPMVRNIMIFILALIAGMVLLSEIGIDTGPLLAGAGVLGVALGFGSQTLVKDFLTGMFILIEDTIAVGDVVQLGDHKGSVESMTLRTVKLRDVQGALHVVPFSSIADIVNMSKDYAYALLDMDVDYGSDLNKVQEVILRVGNELGEDPEYKDNILEPISIMGVQAFASSSITIRSRIKTVGGKQWEIRRAFFARIKPAFDEASIEIPFPHVVHVNR